MASPPPPKMPATPKKPIAPWRLKLAKALPWLFGLFAVGGIVQVFLAGYGIENLGAQGMGHHATFAHVIEAIPLLILIVGFVGADWRAGVMGIALLVLFQAQYFMLDAPQPWNGLHAANGALLIALATIFCVRRLPGARPRQPVAQPAARAPANGVARPAASVVRTPQPPAPATPPQR